jgi:3-dehydrosphinganine reductase
LFKDKVIIITGGSSGLGKALAKRLVAQGAHVGLVARDKRKLEDVKDELIAAKGAGQKIESFSCDVSSQEATENAFHDIARTLGEPDVLINSAGILKEGYFEKLPLSTFRDVMDINFFGIIHCIQAVLPYFKKKGSGRIVNIASLGGKIGAFGYGAYCSSKFALVGLTDILRAELKPQNILLHLVCPGEFQSPMVDDLNTYRTAENKAVAQTVPVLSLDRVADDVMAGLLKNSYLIIPGKLARVIEAANRWFPTLTRWVTDMKISRIYKGPDALKNRY